MSLNHCPNCGCQLKAFEPIRYGNVRVEGLSEIVFKGRAVALARTQHGIVEALIRARGRYLSREMLVGVLGSEIYDQAIRQYVKRARAAFLAIDPGFDQIESLRGFGAYRWRYRADDALASRPLLTVHRPMLFGPAAGPDLGA
jgi:DNA-binding response OmpR family regulator